MRCINLMGAAGLKDQLWHPVCEKGVFVIFSGCDISPCIIRIELTMSRSGIHCNEPNQTQ